MTDPPRLIYDGDCAFCTATAMRLARHWTTPAEAVPWQRLGDAGLDALGLSLADVEQAAWWVSADGHRFRGHAAAAQALMAAGGWRARAGKLLLVPPISWSAAGAYLLIARWRHRLPGGTPACRLDPPE